MDPENNGTINTTGAEKEQKNAKPKSSIANKAGKVKKASSIVIKIVTKIPTLGTVGLIILIIILIIGLIGFFTSLPGTFIDSIKAFGKDLWSRIVDLAIGEGITTSVTEEDQIALAQKIEDMGYDIVGYGFADAEYEYDSEENAEDYDGVTNSKIVGITPLDKKRNYLQAYIAQNEAMYRLSSWSLVGWLRGIGQSGVNNVLAWLTGEAGDSDRIEGLNGKIYSEGMINVTVNDAPFSGGFGQQVSIDRDRKLLKIQSNRIGINNELSIGFGDTFYFDMTDWTSIYGKPIELFLSLHLATMMPDLTFDLAASDAFNTKVNIDLQEVQSTFKVIYRKEDGTELSQSDIEKVYLKVMCNMTDEQIARFEAAGRLEDAFLYIITHMDVLYPIDRVYATEGSTIIDRSEYELSEQRIAFDLGALEQSLLGQVYSTVEGVTIEEEVPTGSGAPGVGIPLPGGITTTSREDQTINQVLPIVDLNNLDEVAAAQATLDTTVLSGITVEQLEELKNLIKDGSEESTAYLPRIDSVIRHWYYKDITFEYGRAGTAKKKVQFTTEAEDDPLSEQNLNGASIILDTTYTSAQGVFYQLAEPEAEGPNDVIVALFTGGSGTTSWGDSYDFSGEYYRYDGTRLRAQLIANAKADEAGEEEYTFQGVQYRTQPVEDADMQVYKEPVSFVTTDEYGNESKQSALTAFSILENVHSVEAESIYRMLKELVIELGYFTREDFMKPLNQVLLWPVERVGSETEVGDENEDIVTRGITKKENEYGLFLENGVAVNQGDSIIAPGDAKVISVDGNTITIKFKTISDGNAEALKQKFGSDYFDVDRDIVLDMEMTFSGINPSVSVGDEVTAGSQIGTATDEDLHILLYDMNRTIVDDIETYMYPTYKGTRLGIFETETETETDTEE